MSDLSEFLMEIPAVYSKRKTSYEELNFNIEYREIRLELMYLLVEYFETVLSFYLEEKDYGGVNKRLNEKLRRDLESLYESLDSKDKKDEGEGTSSESLSESLSEFLRSLTSGKVADPYKTIDKAKREYMELEEQMNILVGMIAERTDFYSDFVIYENLPEDIERIERRIEEWSNSVPWVLL